MLVHRETKGRFRKRVVLKWGLSNGGLRPLSAIRVLSIVHFCGLFGPLFKRNFRCKMSTIVGNRGQLCTSTLSPYLLSPLPILVQASKRHLNMNFLVQLHREIKGRFRKRVVLANVPCSGFRSGGTWERTLVPVFVPGEHPNVPSFRLSFRGNIRRNHPFVNHPFFNPRLVRFKHARVETTPLMIHVH